MDAESVVSSGSVKAITPKAACDPSTVLEVDSVSRAVEYGTPPADQVSFTRTKIGT